ncbi:hypothetical protein CR513_13034, partial [Mucuna pruriens]
MNSCMLTWKSTPSTLRKLFYWDFSWAHRGCKLIKKNFHGLASFYRCIFRDINTIVAPLNEIIKKDMGFRWEEPQEKAL